MKLRSLWLAALVLLVPLLATAGTTGKIAGQVTDNEGNPLVGANVVLAGTARGASTDLDGYYFIIGIPPGQYDVTASHLGHQTVTLTDVLVQVDRTTTTDFVLQPQAVAMEEVVVVASRREAVERDVTSSVRNVTREELESLPTETIEDALQLQAGVVEAGGLHVRGGRGGEVAYMIDGHRVEDPLYGGNYSDLNAEAVEQMELITGTFNAEYGNAMSGIVNIVTRENTTELDGRLRTKLSRLGIEEESNLLNQRFVEGSISGPVTPGGRLGFLLSGRLIREGSYYEKGEFIRNEQGQVTGRDHNAGEAFGFDNSNNVFAKIFASPSERTKLATSYTWDTRRWRSYSHSYRYIPDSAYVRDQFSHLVGFNFTHNVSRDLFYEARASFYQLNYLKTYNDYEWNQYSDGAGQRFNNEFLLGSRNEEYIDQETRTITGKVDATWQANKRNQIKAGAELKQHNIDYFYIYGPHRLPEERYINDYDNNPYEGALYAQDKVEFESIVLNAGLRFDFHDPNVTGFEPVEDPDDAEPVESELKTQLSPRLGIAYPVTDRMVFHFAYGHFFQRPNYEVLYEDLNRRLTVRNPLIGDPNLEPQHTVSYELGVDTELFPGATLQATLFSKKITDLIGVVWQPQGPGHPVAYAYYTNEEFAYVRGFELSGRWRGPVFSLGFNYTFSLAEGSSSSQAERYAMAPEVAGSQSLQFYPLDFDRRHVGNIFLNAHFGPEEAPFGLPPAVFERTTYSLVFEAGSGLPFTYNPTRKRFESDLNNARMDTRWTVDLEAEKRFAVAGDVELGVFLQVYDLFDVDNITSVYSYTGKPDDSGDETEYSYDFDNNPLNFDAPRTIFLGASLNF